MHLNLDPSIVARRETRRPFRRRFRGGESGAPRPTRLTACPPAVAPRPFLSLSRPRRSGDPAPPPAPPPCAHHPRLTACASLPMWQAQITAVEPRAAKWRLGNGHRSRPLFGAYRSDGCARARPGAVLCEGSSTCWHVYEFSEHGGRRGQPLCASAAGVGGAGGVGVGVCDRIGSGPRAGPLDGGFGARQRVAGDASAPVRAAVVRHNGEGREPPRRAPCRVIAVLWARRRRVLLSGPESQSACRQRSDAPRRTRARRAECRCASCALR